MAGKVLNIKVCSPLKLRSGLTGKKPAICHYSYNLPLGKILCRPEKCLHNYEVDMYKNDQILKRFSESFKLKILAELSTGKYSKRELSRLYGVASSTINDWVRKYDRKADAYRTYATNTTRTDFDFTNDKSTNHITAGLGYRFGKSYMDVAYVLHRRQT